ncbi:adenylate cyclase CyaK [soil metagenome]
MMRFRLPRSRPVLLLCLALPTALSVFGLWYVGLEFMRELEVKSWDMVAKFGLHAAPDPDIVFIGVDDNSMDVHNEDPEDLAQSPVLQKMAETRTSWSRGIHAALIDRLADAGAKVIVFDMLFFGRKAADLEGDQALQEAIERHQEKVVLAASLTMPDANLGQSQAMISLPDNFLPWDPLPGDVGFAEFFPRGIAPQLVRAGTYRLALHDLGANVYATDEVYYSLGAAALLKAGYSVPDTRDEIPFRYPRFPGTVYKPIPYYEVFMPRLWEPNFAGGDFFKDKIVVIGDASRSLQDVVQTPKGQLPGPLAHVCFIAAAKNGETYHYAGPGVQGISIILAVLLAYGMGLAFRQPLVQAFALVAGIAALFYGATLVYSHADFLIPPGVPSLALGLTGLWIFGSEFAIERFQKRRVRRLLERCVSRDVVSSMLDQPEELSLALGGSYKQATILFTDLRNFTTTTEGMDAIELVTQLNEYLGEMVDAVFNHQGSIDKFIGDAVMAVWGTVRTSGPKTDCLNAVKAAMEMQERLARLNARWESEGRNGFKFGAGINHGQVVFGNMGSHQKMEPTVIGDAVNVAARLESITKELGVPLAIGESVANHVSDEYPIRHLGEIPLKGKSRPLAIFTLECLAPPRPKEEVPTLAKT